MSAIDLAAYIRARLNELKMTTTAAAKDSGISRQTWHKLLRADISEARLSTLAAVANTLDTQVLGMLRIYFNEQSLTAANGESTNSMSGFAFEFISDVTYPDNSDVKAGEEFEKVWEVANLGTKPWVGWHLQCIDDSLRSAQAQQNMEYSLQPQSMRIEIPTTRPGEHVHLRVRFKAPDHPCSAVSYWKGMNAEGELVFPTLTGLYCMVNVM